MTQNNRMIEAINEYIYNLPENIQEITTALRKVILDASAEFTEELKWSMPNYSSNGLVCYLQASKKHVNLGFHKGIKLEKDDSENLLQGSGKALRHVRIKKMEDIKPDEFTILIKKAIQLNAK